MAGVRRRGVIEFLLFVILRLFRVESGRDRGRRTRKIIGSISAGAQARTAAAAMSAISLMFVMYLWLYLSDSYTLTIPH
jgi:hypothetical protein